MHITPRSHVGLLSLRTKADLICLRRKILCLVCLCRCEEAVETESAPSAGYKSSDHAGKDDFTSLNHVKG